MAIAACGGDDEESAGAQEAALPVPRGDYVVRQVSCPDGFSLADDAPGTALIDFVVMDDGEGSSNWQATDDVAVACLSDSDGDPFPFDASQIEFDIAPDGVVTGSATWSDSVGLSMNALISGSIVDLLDDFVLTLTAPNGDTLSEIVIIAGSV